MALAIAAAFIGGSAHAFGWSDLWLTPDQRAERLLRRGDAVAAARLFRDPRRRAYAESVAQHYATAAATLKRFTDPLSEYDRGNALARAGRLSEAVGAYTAALRTAPHGSELYHDALHNRAIVERRIKAQPPAKSSQPQQGQPGQQGQKGSQVHQGSQGQQGQQGQSGQSGQNGQPGQSGQQSQNGQPGQSGQQSQNRQQSQSGQQGQSGQPNHSGQPGQNSPQGQTGQQSQSASAVGPRAAPASAAASAASAAAAAARARRDAEFALHGVPPGTGGTQSPPRPQSERALSLDQWLRWIPDNPGGLLRRKFMIEHLLQQEREGSRR
ncbi:MAG: hypothetical protein KGL36_00595 [Gammaproteobacteria bacterium]|nr:hypothetical protein [Gammaproteobacteria bacterium]